MFNLDRWLEIWDTLVRNKLRTILTMMAMSWGIFMLVMLLGLGNGLQNGVMAMFADDAVNSIWVFPGQTSVAHEGLPIGRTITFKNDDLDEIRKDPRVDNYSGRFQMRGGFDGGELQIRHDKKVATFDIRSVHPGHQQIENTQIILGRFLNEADQQQRRKVTVIGYPVAEFLFGRRDVLGEWIHVNRIPFQIVGVFDDSGGDRERKKVYVPIATAQAAFNGADRIHMMMFTVGDASPEESAVIAKETTDLLANRHSFSATDPQAIRINNNIENAKGIRMMFLAIGLFIWAMGGCAIVAGIVGVSNIMMIAVRERTKEIGIRKALGATPGTIISTIVQEAVVLTAIAGYFGLLAGVGLLALISFALGSSADVPFFKDPQVRFDVAIQATVLLMIAGSLAGFFPARQAAKVNPIVALRDE
jgi:putative ABC transport system permease protein